MKNTNFLAFIKTAINPIKNNEKSIFIPLQNQFIIISIAQAVACNGIKVNPALACSF